MLPLRFGLQLLGFRGGGARGYLVKAESSQCLLAAIRRVLEGKVFVSENVMTSIASKLGARKNDLQPIEPFERPSTSGVRAD